MSSPPSRPDQPLAWRAVTDGTPVEGADGTLLGHVADILGSDAEDIFHGLLVKRVERGPECVVLAEHVTLMTATHVQTDLTPPDVAGLPAYEPEATFHLGITGLLRKHEGWIKGG